MKSILNDVKQYSLEKQHLISKEIVKHINKVIREEISASLESFALLMEDIGDVSGKSILLLQPDKYMTLGIFLSLNGASIVHGLNRFVNSEQRISNYYEELLDFVIKNKDSVIRGKEMTNDEITESFNDIVSIDTKSSRSYLNRDRVQFSPNEDTSAMPYKDGKFDIVISNYVFERLYYPFQSLNEIRRVMTKNALLYILTSPNGSEVTDSARLVSVLKRSDEVYEKNFSYRSADYCSRIQKPELLSHLNNFHFAVDSVRDLNVIQIAPYDKKEINPRFLLCGEKELSTLTYIVTARKREMRSDSFDAEDYKTYSKALDLQFKGSYNAARARYESLMRKRPSDDRVIHSLFNTLYFLKDYENAHSMFRQIKKSKVKLSVSDYYHVADSLYHLEKYKEAKKFFMTAEKADPKQHLIINAIGLCEYMQGDVVQGLKEMKRAVRVYPYFS